MGGVGGTLGAAARDPLFAFGTAGPGSTAELAIVIDEAEAVSSGLDSSFASVRISLPRERVPRRGSRGKLSSACALGTAVDF